MIFNNRNNKSYDEEQEFSQNKFKFSNIIDFLYKNIKILIISGVIVLISAILLLVNKNLTQGPVSSKNGLSIKLLGDSTVTVNAKTDFLDPGYVAIDKKDGDLTKEVQLIGIVDFNTPGKYERYYVVENSRGTIVETKRTIIVEDENVTDDIVELTLTLKGNTLIELEKGATYVEPGYVASDNTGKDLTNEVKVSSNLKNNVVGTYQITYTLTKDGITKTLTRKVNVIDKKVEPITVNIKTNITVNNTKLTNSSVIITLKIAGTGYDYTVLPSGYKSYFDTINYTVSSNGTYVFNVYDKNGGVKTIEKTITNIDNVAPTGTCHMDKNGLITTNVTDNVSETLYYSYYINNEYTSYSTNKTYQTTYTQSEVLVQVKDELDNIGSIKCTKEALPDVLDPIVPSSFKYSAISDTLKIWVIKKSDHYITKIWAKEPYKQIHMYTVNDYGKDHDIFSNIMDKAVKNAIDKNKIAVAWNDALTVWYGGRDSDEFSKYTGRGLIIKEGKIIRNDATSHKYRESFYGIDTKNKLNFYKDAKRLAIETRKKTYESAINSGILNTFTAARPAVENGVNIAKNQRSDGSSYYAAEGQGFCQVNANNFIYVTLTKKYMPKKVGELMAKAGCVDGFFVDGGGSTTFNLKNKSGNKWTHKIKGGGRSRAWSIVYWTEL